MQNQMSLQKVLIANRGEIAQRLFRACRSLGLASVAVFAEPDAGAAWLSEASERYPLAGESATDTYLNQAAILQIAQTSGADALHPGYGFLSENAAFARACAAAGINFVGPSAEAMEIMGSKAQAREVALRAGVPVVPGLDGAGLTNEALKTAAGNIGFPVLIKASAGGGGKGMRIVWSADEFGDGLQAARREAQSAFGDDHILLEKFIAAGRHIEVQVLGDKYGNVIHLYERDCSVQRRYQKIIEETPAPELSETVRQAMTEAAVALAEAVKYESAGTVEFILAPENAFYLLEMNTRLQVEHPVTELLTGMDLAVWQLRIAGGERLALPQSPLPRRGHAIECRVYAEDPARNFLPSIGEIAYYRPPAGPHIRVDDGIASGSQVTPYYDPLLAKIICWGADRAEARRNMVVALADTIILGVTTNIPYLQAILASDHFAVGGVTTNFLDREFPSWRPGPPSDAEVMLAAAAGELFSQRPVDDERRVVATLDPWDAVGRWRNV